MERLLGFLKDHAQRAWFPFALALAALIDHFVIIIPIDGILVSTTLLTPRRWARLALGAAIGSTLGAGLLAYAVATGGEAAIARLLPSLGSAGIWTQSHELFQKYGVYAVAIFAVSPFAQQPAVIVAALGGTPLGNIVVATLLGRSFKSFVYAWIASHAPRYLPSIVTKELPPFK